MNPRSTIRLSSGNRLANLRAFVLGLGIATLSSVAHGQLMYVPPGDRVAASADVRFNGSLSTLDGYHPTSLTRELPGPGRLSGNPEVNFARAQADLNTAALRGFVRGGEGGGPTGLATTSRATSYLREWITLAADPGSPSNLSVPGEFRFHLSVGYDMGPHPTGYLSNLSTSYVSLNFSSEVLVTGLFEEARLDNFERSILGTGEYDGPVLTSYTLNLNRRPGTSTRTNGATVLGQPQVDLRLDSTGSLDMTYTVPFEASPGQEFFLNSEVILSTNSGTPFIVGGQFEGYYEIDLPTGYDFTSSSGTFALQPIPEPTVTAALLGLILPGVALFRRRSRRNQPFTA